MAMEKCIKDQAICSLVTLIREKLTDQANIFSKMALIMKVTLKTTKLKPLKDIITQKTYNTEEDSKTTLSTDKVNKLEGNTSTAEIIITVKELKALSNGIPFQITMFTNISIKESLITKENSMAKVFNLVIFRKTSRN